MNYTNRIFPAAIVATMFICVVTLAGCGGGGSSHSPIIPDPVIPDPVIPDPVIPDPGTLGAMDDYYQPGGGFSAFIGDTTPVTDSGLSTLTYSAGLNLLNRRLEGPRLGDPSVVLPLPPTDIRQAWRDGWTGGGVNILIVDAFALSSLTQMGENTHGYTVLSSAMQLSPRANYFSLYSGDSPGGSGYRQRGLRDVSDDSAAPSSTRIDVINWSFGAPPEPDPLTADDIDTERSIFADLYDDISGGSFLPNTADAVITKAAGNEDGADAARVVDNLALIRDSGIGPRTLIVGALDGWAQDGGAEIASYSNVAGDSAEMQNRFLVEYGGSPYAETTFSCPRTIVDCTGTGARLGDEGDNTVGTSFATPRVAGHAALLRDKFPNLTGGQSANILLDTATTEGIICHPSCPVQTYGQGRVNIGRALAPVGTME